MYANQVSDSTMANPAETKASAPSGTTADQGIVPKQPAPAPQLAAPPQAQPAKAEQPTTAQPVEAKAKATDPAAQEPTTTQKSCRATCMKGGLESCLPQ